jgi:hypothetical protein
MLRFWLLGCLYSYLAIVISIKAYLGSNSDLRDSSKLKKFKKVINLLYTLMLFYENVRTRVPGGTTQA